MYNNLSFYYSRVSLRYVDNSECEETREPSFDRIRMTGLPWVLPPSSHHQHQKVSCLKFY